MPSFTTDIGVTPMATEFKPADHVTESVETAAERLAEFNEKAVAEGRKASIAYLDSYENAVLSMADSYETAAAASSVDWASSIAAAQATYTRELTKAYTGAARELVAASR
jgi:hypothetical protein